MLVKASSILVHLAHHRNRVRQSLATNSTVQTHSTCLPSSEEAPNACFRQGRDSTAEALLEEHASVSRTSMESTESSPSQDVLTSGNGETSDSYHRPQNMDLRTTPETSIHAIQANAKRSPTWLMPTSWPYSATDQRIGRIRRSHIRLQAHGEQTIQDLAGATGQLIRKIGNRKGNLRFHFI